MTSKNPRAIKNRYVCKPVMVCICVGFCVGSRCIDAKEGPQWTRKKEREPATRRYGEQKSERGRAGLSLKSVQGTKRYVSLRTSCIISKDRKYGGIIS